MPNQPSIQDVGLCLLAFALLQREHDAAFFETFFPVSVFFICHPPPSSSRYAAKRIYNVQKSDFLTIAAEHE